MSIPVQCEHCFKKYNAPDSMAGKKIKCRNCGKVFSVPGGAEDELDLSALQADEAAAGLGDDDLMSGTASGTRAGVSHGSRSGGRVGSDPSKGIAHKRARTGDAGDIPIASPSHDDGPPRRKSLPFDFPGADVLDNIAPILLIVLGLGWLALMAFNSNNTGVGWVGMLRAGLYVLLYAALAFPLCYAAVKWAAKASRFMLPPSPALRAFGAFAVPFALAFAFWLSGQSAVALILGSIVGAVIAGAAVWFLFRVQPNEMGNALGGATGAFAASVIASYLVLLGVNMIFAAVMSRADTNELTRSPVAPAFAWDVPIKKGGDAVKATGGGGTKIVIATRPTEDPTTVPSTTPDPTTNVAPPTTTTVPTTTQETTRPTTTEMATNPPPVQPPTTDPKPVVPVAPASPFVEQVTPANVGQYTELLFPATPSNFMAVIRTSAGEFTEDTIEQWTINPPERKAQLPAPFRRDKEAFGGYALSPNGDLIARLNAWPQLSVQIYSISKQNIVREFPFTAAAPRVGAPGAVAPAPAVHITAKLMGFATNDALVVHSIKGAEHWIEVLNLRAAPNANPLIAGFTIDRFEDASGNPSISPDGTKLAVSTQVKGEGGIDVYDIGMRRPKHLIKTFPVQINPWTKPVGLAWAPNNQFVAAYWDDGSARGILYNCRLAGDIKTAVKTHLYPIAPYPAQLPRTYKGRTFDFLPDGSTFLLFGEHLIDAETGKKLGELAISAATSQRIVDKEQIAVQSQSGDADGQGGQGQQTLSVVKLKPDVINNKRLELKRAGGTAASIGH